MMKINSDWKDQARKVQPFKVPEGYFDGFEDRMMTRLLEEAPVIAGKGRTRRLIYWISGVAAALIIGFAGIQQFVLKPQPQADDQDLMFAVVEYFTRDLDDFTLAALMAENEDASVKESGAEPDLLDFMNVDDLTLLESLVNGN